jgi:hypothetical protein
MFPPLQYSSQRIQVGSCVIQNFKLIYDGEEPFLFNRIAIIQPTLKLEKQ